MTSLEEIMQMWAEDAKIDQIEAGEELLRIPVLHSKYLCLLAENTAQSKKLEREYAKARKIMYEYYSGDLNNPEDLERYGFTEPMMKTILKQNMPLYLDSDRTLNNILAKKSEYDQIIDVCAAILKELNSRTYQLRAFIDWEKLNRGAT